MITDEPSPIKQVTDKKNRHPGRIALLSIVAVLFCVLILSVIFSANITKYFSAHTASETQITQSTQTLVTDGSIPAITTEYPLQPDDFGPNNVIEPAAVTDDDTTPIIIYSWNDEFETMLTDYYGADHPDFVFDYRVTESSTYQTKLDSVLSTGDGAPDIYLIEADYATKYVNSDTSLNINEIGIDYAELADQYEYTYEFMMDDCGAIKALSWQSCPSGVFYNKTLAETWLGSSDPVEVQKSFATWDAFLAMAQKINTDSAGTVKAISGLDDIWRPFLASRSTGWVVDGVINIDPMMDTYLDYAKTIKDEGLTFETAQWNTDWTANMSNSSVLSYWGPMWLAQNYMGFDVNADGTLADGANPTTGDWDFCAAPVSFFWGGTWITASKYDNQKETTADIMRYFTIDPVSMSKLAMDGQFVNNIWVVSQMSDDPDFGVNFLGGANPFDRMLLEAMRIDVSTVTANDQAINTIWASVVACYVNGDIATVAEAKQQFAEDCADILA